MVLKVGDKVCVKESGEGYNGAHKRIFTISKIYKTGDKQWVNMKERTPYRFLIEDLELSCKLHRRSADEV